jgi:CheY-like chemotaxis protein/signal recognition particle receptor subunit beta
MALFNHATKEVTAKLVYYGPGLCGKTTNLQWIHGNLSFKTKGKLVSLATQTDRTLFFDFLPVELGTIRGMRTRMQIYTVPGQVFYESTRRMVLKGCDAVVFVADSQAAMLDANAESLRSLRQNLLVNEIDPTIPQVIQYNKRDLPTALPISVLNERLNPRNLPWFEAVAFKGTGVEETLKGITKLLFQWLSRYYGEGDAAAASATAGIGGPSSGPENAPVKVTVRVPHATLKIQPEELPKPAAPMTPAGVPAVAPPAAPRPAAPAPPRPAAPPTARPQAPAPPAPQSELPSTIVFAKAKPQAPAPATPPARPPAPARPAPPPTPPAAPPEDELASTIVFAKSKPAVPEAPAEIIKPQPVVVPGAAAKATPPPPAMSVPPPIPAGAKFEAPKPAAPEPSVFREPEKPAPPADPAPRGEGLRADQWLYLLDGAQRGPIDVEDLIDLVLTSIPEDTKVWHPGLEAWVRANQLREIAEEIPPPLPIPGAQRGALVEEDMPDFNTVPGMLRTVLIADEDAAFRKYLAMPLAAQGFTIYEAADGAAAWQIAVQNRPWMILADISMPEVDGFEFCRRVRNHPLLARVPLLFISGSDKYKERYRALQIGADDFLSKNMPIRELLMRIQLLMTRYSDLSAEQKPGTEDVAGAFQGRIEVFGAPALLQMCAQGRLTGLFTALAEDAANTATVMGFREGDIISAACGGTSGADGVYAFLAWEKGSFKFTPGDPGSGEPLAQSVEHLLLEGCRLLDESRKDGDGGGEAFA